MTVPYTSGTITLVKGSTDIVGVDTAWKAALIVGGIIFVNVPNVGAMSLPIATVDDNTKIMAAIPWQGANGTYSYALVRDGAFERQSTENAVKLAALLNEMRSQAISQLSGLTPAADKLPYFGPGGAGALADFPASARALLNGGQLPNSQLPNSLRGYSAFVTDLNAILTGGWVAVGPETAGIPKPGYFGVLTIPWSDNTSATQIAYPTLGEDVAYRRHRANGVWGPWRAAGASSVGQVYNANGMPSGAIIERGSNANGEYTRFADGTQICTASAPTGNPTLQSKEAIAFGAFTYAASFISPPRRSLSYDGSWSHTLHIGSEGGGSVSTAGVAIYNLDTVSHAYAGTVYMTAIGRWY